MSMTNPFSQDLQNRLQRLVEAHFGPVEDLRGRVQEGDATLVMEAAALLDEHLPVAMRELAAAEESSAFYLLAANDPLFQERIKQLVLEWIASEPLHPPVWVIPAGLGDEPFPPYQGPVQAVVVEYMAHAANEVYPLMVDGYVHDLERYGQPARNLVMVHERWLDEEMRTGRALYFDPDRDAMIERELPEPVKPDGVLFLCLSPNAHRRLSEITERYGIPQVNPYRASVDADDKFLCYERWQEKGVLTPPAYRLLRNDASDESLEEKLREGFGRLFAFEKEAESIALMLQPVHGTEGRGVKAFAGPNGWDKFMKSQPELLSHAKAIMQENDLLLRVGVGNTLWMENADKPRVRFDLRLNVIDGRAESGYSMAAREGAFVSSPGRGGRVVEWKNGPEWTIQTPEGKRNLSLRSEEGRGILEMAERAAACFPGCRMAGVDIRLEWDSVSRTWKPWILDLNPRPAGLAHSRYIERDEPGVTMRLWSHFSRDEIHS